LICDKTAVLFNNSSAGLVGADGGINHIAAYK
jgi:hypothetical protein